MLMHMHTASSAPLSGVIQVRRKRKSSATRLTPNEVYEMRVRAQNGALHRTLASEYGVSQSAATRAINGTTFRDLPHPVVVKGSGRSVIGEREFHPYEEAQGLLRRTNPAGVTVIEEESAMRITPSLVLRCLRELEELDNALKMLGHSADG